MDENKLYICCVQRPFWFPFTKKCLSFFGQKISWNTSSPSTSFLKRQPLVRKFRRVFRKSSLFNQGPYTAMVHPATMPLGPRWKRQNDGKEKTESPLSCNRGASKNFLLKLEDEGGIVFFFFFRWNHGKITIFYIILTIRQDIWNVLNNSWIVLAIIPPCLLYVTLGVMRSLGSEDLHSSQVTDLLMLVTGGIVPAIQEGLNDYPPWNQQRVYPWRLMVGSDEFPFWVRSYVRFSVSVVKNPLDKACCSLQLGGLLDPCDIPCASLIMGIAWDSFFPSGKHT